MTVLDPNFELRIASREEDVLGAQRLRYRVFVEELRGDGEFVDHDQRLERDRFDPYFDHLVLVDARRNPTNLDHVIGVYRVMQQDAATQAGGFYSANEYDLSPLVRSGRKVLELGRSCVDKDHRNGTAMFALWSGLADYVHRQSIEVLFGVASFHGQDLDQLAEPLSLLSHRYLAPKPLRVTALPEVYQSMDLMPEANIDRTRAMRAVPSLIKAYLRLGGVVGDGAFIDREFNTTDVCLVMDTRQMNARRARLYGQQP
jgi:putative hemolysin